MTDPLLENQVVADRFRLVRMIGRGGMGSVWQALHIGLDTPCALKFIEGEFANIAEAHSRFEREAKAAAQLRSPHVVQIIDHGVWAGRPYIAMELLDGEDLGKALAKAGGKLAPSQVNVVIQQVARALTKAHAGGIVHRDLKPDNIFLVNDDDRQIVKILDFGVAKSTGQAIDGSNTKTGAMLGTPYYMSPEQAQGIKSVDARSDLWSLAVIVYQCITGRLPFESEALGDLLVKIIVQPVPVPSQIAPVPPGFDRWWAKAASREPEGRFQTAKDFATSLEIALGATGGLTEVGMQQIPNQLQGTAVIQLQRPFGGTPNPNTFSAPQHTTALGATPHPAKQANQVPHMRSSVQGMVVGGAASAQSSGGFGGPNPATFSGVEPPITIPKKGPNLGVIAGVGAFVLIVVVGGGFVFLRNRANIAAGHGPTSTTPTSTVIATASAIPTTTTASDETTPTPPASVATTDAVPTTTTAPDKPIAKLGGGAGAGGTRPAIPPTTKPTASAQPTAAAQPSASAKKWVPGF